jgi:hypothetical protein
VTVTQLEERERGVAELERLWEAPAIVRGAERPAPSLGARIVTHSRMLTFAWAAAVVTIAAAPAPANEADAPLVWWDMLYLAGVVLAVLGLGHVASRLGRLPFGWCCSATAGAVGITLGIACRASEHHLGSWWVAETAAFGLVTAVSIGGAYARRSPAPRPG